MRTPPSYAATGGSCPWISRRELGPPPPPPPPPRAGGGGGGGAARGARGRGSSDSGSKRSRSSSRSPASRPRSSPPGFAGAEPPRVPCRHHVPIPTPPFPPGGRRGRKPRIGTQTPRPRPGEPRRGNQALPCFGRRGGGPGHPRSASALASAVSSVEVPRPSPADRAAPHQGRKRDTAGRRVELSGKQWIPG